jgi:peroxiredoxin
MSEHLVEAREVYKAFGPPLVYADEIGEWGLLSEPWTFVLDKEGKVAHKFGGPVSPRELTEALIPLLP